MTSTQYFSTTLLPQHTETHSSVTISSPTHAHITISCTSFCNQITPQLDLVWRENAFMSSLKYTLNASNRIRRKICDLIDIFTFGTFLPGSSMSNELNGDISALLLVSCKVKSVQKKAISSVLSSANGQSAKVNAFT